jgi:hypothetical protein
VADCLSHGVIIGATNRSLYGLNNTLCLSPALIATADDIDPIANAMDSALNHVIARQAIVRAVHYVRRHTFVDQLWTEFRTRRQNRLKSFNNFLGKSKIHWFCKPKVGSSILATPFSGLG